MKSSNSIKLIAAVFLAAALTFTGKVQAQTTGTLTFSVTTTATGGFSPRNIIAIWLQNSSNAFVKTKLKLAATQEARLLLWNASSGGNVVDAVTGATQTSHGTRSISWNATNVAGTVVPDGNYSVWIEMAWGNNSTTQKASTSITFAKGTSSVHLTPASTTNFSGMVLDWVPTGVGISEDITRTDLFSVSPNPVSNQSVINYSLTGLTDVTITLFDVTGRQIGVLFDDNQNAGNYSLPLSVNGKLKPGVYFVKMYTGNAQQVLKILVSN